MPPAKHLIWPDLACDCGCGLAWATTWAVEANEVLAPRLGLPRLPVVDWPDDEDDGGRLHWKTRRLIEWAAGRRLARFDDEITDADRTWVAANYSASALHLHRIDPRRGLTDADYHAIAQWLNEEGLNAIPICAEWHGGRGS